MITLQARNKAKSMLRRMQTSFLPKEVVRNRMYEVAPEGGDGGGGGTDGNAAPVTTGDDDFQIPDKFKGETEKESLKKAVTSYQELEKELGKRGNSAQEIAEIKNTLNELRQSIVPKETTPEADQLEEQKKFA